MQCILHFENFCKSGWGGNGRKQKWMVGINQFPSFFSHHSSVLYRERIHPGWSTFRQKKAITKQLELFGSIWCSQHITLETNLNYISSQANNLTPPFSWDNFLLERELNSFEIKKLHLLPFPGLFVEKGCPHPGGPPPRGGEGHSIKPPPWPLATDLT